MARRSGGRADACFRTGETLALSLSETRTWAPLHTSGTGPTPRSGHTATVVRPGQVWVYGGEGASRGVNRRDVFSDVYALEVRVCACV